MLEGMKFDSEKPRFDLMDAYALEQLAFGAKKYAAHNWRKGINYSRLIAAAMRPRNWFATYSARYVLHDVSFGPWR